MRAVILTLLFLSTVLNYIDRQALSVLVPTLRVDLKMTGEQYGNIASLFMIAYSGGQLLMGRFIDKVGTRLGFLICILVWSVAGVAHFFATSVLVLGAARFVLGIGESGNWPAGTKAIAEWFPAERRASAMGIFDGGSAIGAIIAPPLVAGLALWQGWRFTFVVTGLLGFAWACAWLMFFPKTTAGAVSPVSRERTPYAELLKSRPLWGLMLTRMLATPVWWFYVLWLPDYLSKGRGFSLKEIAMFAWIPFLTVDIGKLFGGGLSDRLRASGRSSAFSRKSVMTLAAILMAAGTRVAGAESATVAIVWVSIATFGFGMWSANILALHADVFPSAVMGSAVGLTGAAAGIGGSAFTYVVGRIADVNGYAPVFWAAGSLALFALIALFAVHRDAAPVERYATT